MTYLRSPRLPGGHPRRRAGSALATAALAALALAITGSGTALASPASPQRPATIGTVAGPLAATAAATPGCAVTSVAGATWMHDLAPCLQNHTLAHIVIPGSHDTLTYSFSPAAAAGIATTQDEDLTHQLNDGMRDFDLRVKFTLGNNGFGWYANHGAITSQ